MRDRGVSYSMRKQTNPECGTFYRTTDLVSIIVNGIFFKKGVRSKSFESKLPNVICLEPLNAIFSSSQSGLYLTLLFSLLGIFFLKHKSDHFTAPLKSFNPISKLLSCLTSPFTICHFPTCFLIPRLLRLI